MALPCSPLQLWILLAIDRGIHGYANIGEFIWADHSYASAKSRSGIGLKISATLTKMERSGSVQSYYQYNRLIYQLTRQGRDQLREAERLSFFQEDIVLRRKKLEALYKKGLILNSDYPECLNGLHRLETSLADNQQAPAISLGVYL